MIHWGPDTVTNINLVLIEPKLTWNQYITDSTSQPLSFTTNTWDVVCSMSLSYIERNKELMYIHIILHIYKQTRDRDTRGQGC